MDAACLAEQERELRQLDEEQRRTADALGRAREMEEKRRLLAAREQDLALMREDAAEMEALRGSLHDAAMAAELAEPRALWQTANRAYREKERDAGRADQDYAQAEADLQALAPQLEEIPKKTARLREREAQAARLSGLLPVYERLEAHRQDAGRVEAALEALRQDPGKKPACRKLKSTGCCGRCRRRTGHWMPRLFSFSGTGPRMRRHSGFKPSTRI